jgi:hypothetical protein
VAEEQVIKLLEASPPASENKSFRVYFFAGGLFEFHGLHGLVCCVPAGPLDFKLRHYR